MKLMTLIILALTLASCGDYYEAKEDGFDVTNVNELNGEINFDKIKNEILTPHCIKCHKGYDDYQNVKNDISKIERAIRTGTMPKNDEPLSTKKHELVLGWIKGGMKQGNIISPPNNSDEVIFSNIANKILYPKCVFCHSQDGQASFLDLSNRQSIFEARNGLLDFDDPDASYLLEVVKDEQEPMPPSWSGIEKLNKNEIDLLKEWIKRGIP